MKEIKNKPAASNCDYGSYAKSGKPLSYFSQKEAFMPPKNIKKIINQLKPIVNEILL